MTTIEDIERLGCENGEHRGPPAFPESYRILQDPWELSQFACFVRAWFKRIESPSYEFEKKPSYLEIGMGHGGLFRYMLEAGLVRYAIGVDDQKCEHFRNGLRSTLAKMKEDGFFYRHICGNSHSEIIKRKLIGTAPYDLAFIDGDHSYEGVKNDLLHTMKCMEHLGSLIALHDSIYYGPDGGVAWMVREIEAGEIPGLKVVAKFERVYGIVVCEVT